MAQSDAINALEGILSGVPDELPRCTGCGGKWRYVGWAKQKGYASKSFSGDPEPKIAGLNINGCSNCGHVFVRLETPPWLRDLTSHEARLVEQSPDFQQIRVVQEKATEKKFG